MLAQEWRGIGRAGVSASWDAPHRAAGLGGNTSPSPTQIALNPARKTAPVPMAPLGPAASSWESAAVAAGVIAATPSDTAPIAPSAATRPTPARTAGSPPPHRTSAPASAMPRAAAAPPSPSATRPTRPAAVTSATLPPPRTLASRISVTHVRRLPDDSHVRRDALAVTFAGVRLTAQLNNSQSIGGAWVSISVTSPDSSVTRTALCTAICDKARLDLPHLFKTAPAPRINSARAR
jgi:hypothetical protein